MLLETILTISILGGRTDTLQTDSLPALHTIRQDDIASVVSDFEYDILTVKLRNDSVYVYHHVDWDLEDQYASLSDTLRAAIKKMTKVFIRAEHMPKFPGGQAAWDQYILEFCRNHKKEIKRAGSTQIIVQFMVHLKGQVMDVGIVSNPDGSDLTSLAIKAIQDGPQWDCATQNGYKVLCYQKQVVKLSL
jgi:hypothetical protein